MAREIKPVIAKFNSVNICSKAKCQVYVSLVASIILPGTGLTFMIQNSLNKFVSPTCKKI